MPLPGMESHHKMVPKTRIRQLTEDYLRDRTPRKAAVLNLFYPGEDGITRVLLILRKSYKGVHGNQVGFPGGKPEPEDADLRQTALRETWEEVGVAPQKVNIIRELSQVYIPPSNFMVFPYMGWSDQVLSFQKEESEVEEIIEVKLEDLLAEDSLFYQTLDTSYARNIEVPAFRLNHYTVWGATAMILNEVKALFTGPPY